MADATLSAENQDALDDLLVAIETGGRRLGIFIAVCDDSQLRAEIIKRYEQALAPDFRHYQLTLNRTEPSLKALLTEQVKGDEYLQQGGQAVMTIVGSDRLLGLRLGQERSEQETFFGYLQWTREGLTDFPFAIVLWVTYQMQEQLSRKAPDFWSWRRDVVRFVSPKRSAIPVEDLSHLEDFLFALSEEVGNTLPVADLEALIENTTAKSPNSPMLASLHLQAGKTYTNRLKQGAAQEYETEVEKATAHLETAVRLLESPSPSEEYAGSLSWLAYLYKCQGCYGLAEPLYVRALKIKRKLFGKDHSAVADSLNNLALLYHNQGRYELAEPLYVQALELRRKIFGEDHPAVATSLNNLAGLYDNQGRYELAEPLYIRSLEIEREFLGDDHPTIATSLNNLATLYTNQSRYELAEPLLVQALELRRKLLGEDHPAVVTSLNNLASFYNSQGRYELAEPLYVQASELERKFLSEENPDVAASLSNLANLYANQGRYELAEPLYIQSLGLRCKLLGDDHATVAISLNNLARLYNSQGRYELAEPLYVQAITILRDRLGPNHPNTKAGINNFSQLIEAVVAAGRQSELSDHPYTQQVLASVQSQQSN